MKYAAVYHRIKDVYNSLLHQGIIDPTGTETFAKEPKLAKLLRGLKSTAVLNNKKEPLVFLACLQWQI